MATNQLHTFNNRYASEQSTKRPPPLLSLLSLFVPVVLETETKILWFFFAGGQVHMQETRHNGTVLHDKQALTLFLLQKMTDAKVGKAYCGLTVETCSLFPVFVKTTDGKRQYTGKCRLRVAFQHKRSTLHGMALPHGISPSQLDDVLYDLAARVLENEAAAACAQLTQVERDVKGTCRPTRISSLSISAVRIDPLPSLPHATPSHLLVDKCASMSPLFQRITVLEIRMHESCHQVISNK